MLPDHLPCLVGILAPDDARQRPFSAAAERRLLAHRQDCEALIVLVLGSSSIDAIFLSVLRLDVAARVFTVDMDLALEHHVKRLDEIASRIFMRMTQAVLC